MDLVLKNALIAYQEKQYGTALKYFKKLKSEKKDYYMGLTYVKMEDYKTAIIHLKKYLKMETNYPLMIQILVVLGFIYAQKKEARSAVNELPAKIRKSTPWIRKISSVQKEIRGTQ